MTSRTADDRCNGVLGLLTSIWEWRTRIRKCPSPGARQRQGSEGGRGVSLRVWARDTQPAPQPPGASW